MVELINFIEKKNYLYKVYFVLRKLGIQVFKQTSLMHIM